MEFNPLDISGSALSAERLRMDLIASNMANINTTRNSSGAIDPYKRKMAVFAPILDEKTGEVQGVTVDNIVESTDKMRMVYDPSHPDADANGYVKYPNVRLEQEMVDLVTSKAAYEANVSAIQTYKAIYNSSLDI